MAYKGVQDALFMKNILKSLGLKVKLPILARIDNDRAMDIGHNWSVCGSGYVNKKSYWARAQEACCMTERVKSKGECQ